MRACLGDCIVGFGNWFVCLCVHVRACLGDCIVHILFFNIILCNKAKLKKVCGSTNMDIFFTGGRADFVFLNIYF